MKKKQEYSKAQLMESKSFGYPQDLAGAVLEEDMLYTKEGAKKKIQAYLDSRIEEGEN